jgi:hypothetical protein
LVNTCIAAAGADVLPSSPWPNCCCCRVPSCCCCCCCRAAAPTPVSDRVLRVQDTQVHPAQRWQPKASDMVWRARPLHGTAQQYAHCLAGWLVAGAPVAAAAPRRIDYQFLEHCAGRMIEFTIA